MNDQISRQAAIAVANRTDYLGLTVEDVRKVTDEVVKGLKQLPPAQPESCEDAVSRQYVLDSLDVMLVSCENINLREALKEWFKHLPSVQPEITRCKDCVHYYGEPGNPNIVCFQMHEDDFCSYAEKKEN